MTDIIVKQIILEMSNIDALDINDQDQLKNIGFDSLRLVELILTIEERMNVTFDDSELGMDNLNTVGALIELVKRFCKN